MSSSPFVRLVQGLAWVAWTLAWASLALAQDPYGSGLAPGMGAPPPTTGKTQSAPAGAKEGEPETHAASGSGESFLPPSAEPTLPKDPLELPETVRATIGTDTHFDALAQGRTGDTKRDFYGLYYSEMSGDYRFRAAIPLWFERTQPSLTDPTKVDRASVFGGIYYNRRSAEHSDDVVFPLFWNLRNPLEGKRTTIVGPFVNRVAPDEHDNWLAPLYFTGKRKVGGYTLIPPLLTYTSRDEEGGFNLVGPGFCSYTGGRACDVRTAKDIDFGVAPLYFFGQDSLSQYEVIPPLLHYYSYNDRDLSWTNTWGPYYRKHTQKRDMLHLLPLYYSIWGEDERHTTVFPLLHHGYKGDSWLHINPLFLLGRGEDGESTFVTWGYARYRGRTELDMITPLFWHYRDPDTSLDQKLLFPFLYTRTSPRQSDQVYFPFWGRFDRFGISRTTWITPFFRHSHDLRGWSTSINPLLYLGRSGKQSWTVVAPFFWDFAGTESRDTIGFPFYWRFSDKKEVQQLVGNVYYQERKVAGGLDWQFHIFPAFSYGETPSGHWWNVLFGLAGYTREGDVTKMRTLWIPIQLSGDDEGR